MLENELKKAVRAASMQDGKALACTEEWLEEILEGVQELQKENRRLQLVAEEREEDRPRFKMDANGNLTRIEGDAS